MELTNCLLFFGVSLRGCHFSGRPSRALQLSELLDRRLGLCFAYNSLYSAQKTSKLFFCICRFESHFLELVRRHLTANYASDMTNRYFFGTPVPVYPWELSRSQISGRDFFIPFPFLNFGVEFLSFHICS